MCKIYFVIDTDSYAGNFERQMCAYITGVTGDCGVGEKFVEFAERELGSKIDDIRDNIDMESDEGCYRPAKIYPTPGFYNNGLGFEYKKDDPIELDLAKQAYRDRCTELAKSACYKDAEANKRHEDEWMEKANKCEIGEYQSFQSVAIMLRTNPTQEMLDIMCERARAFELESKTKRDDRWKYIGPITISGFRLVEERVVATETKING